jgi:integrase
MCTGGEFVNNTDAIFKSAFANKLSAFIAEKQALGYRYTASAKTLISFDKAMLTNNITSDCLDENAVMLWVSKRPGEKASNQLCRISAMRTFATYLYQQGEEVFMCAYPHQKDIQVYQPYIFSKTELKRIFIAADEMKYTLRTPFRHLITPVITKTLYGTGMRISEVLKLKRKDVNLEQLSIMAFDTKGGKERLLLISGSLGKLYEKYFEQNDFSRNDYIFPDKKEGHVSIANYYHTFRLLLEEAGILHLGRGSGPRIHDFRHTFSVHRLNQWASEKKDVTAMLPILATYLGHENVRIASYYLRLTAQIYPELTEMVELEFGEVIPDIIAKEREALREYS